MPGAVTGGTDHLTDQSLTLLGTINPAGQSSAYDFEWGTGKQSWPSPDGGRGNIRMTYEQCRQRDR